MVASAAVLKRKKKYLKQTQKATCWGEMKAAENGNDNAADEKKKKQMKAKLSAMQ